MASGVTHKNDSTNGAKYSNVRTRKRVFFAGVCWCCDLAEIAFRSVGIDKRTNIGLRAIWIWFKCGHNLCVTDRTVPVWTFASSLCCCCDRVLECDRYFFHSQKIEEEKQEKVKNLLKYSLAGSCANLFPFHARIASNDPAVGCVLDKRKILSFDGLLSIDCTEIYVSLHVRFRTIAAGAWSQLKADTPIVIKRFVPVQDSCWHPFIYCSITTHCALHNECLCKLWIGSHLLEHRWQFDKFSVWHYMPF